MTALQDKFVEAARGWVDVPYKHLGRDRYGIDCVGVLIKSAHETGFSTYDTKNYSRQPSPREFLRELKGHLDRIQKRDAGHGDVVVFQEPSHPCHVGILDVEKDGTVYVIHAYAPARKVVREAMTQDRWSRALMAFRIPEG